MTFTLMGRDPATGDLFAAVASRWPGVGGVVPYHRSGVGLVCSQNQAHCAMAEAILDAMAVGLPPLQAVPLIIADFDPAIRQVTAMDPAGRYHHWTGDQCVTETGLAEAPGLVAFGNTLADRSVPQAMLDAFAAAGDRPLPERLVRALRAGEQAGGDRRGREAAAVRIWPAAYPHVDHLPIDLRVDEGDDPIGVLEHLLARLREVEPYTRLQRAPGAT